MMSRENRRGRSGFVVLAITTLLAALSPVVRAEVVLQGKQWDVTIDPTTLSARGVLPDGKDVLISAPRATPGAVADLKHDNQQATWSLPDENMSVTMRLEGDALVVQFTATQAGQLTWPTLPPSATPRAYVLPLFEGVYVPADDEPWAKFLVGEEAMNTTAGLSMPFWGVDHGSHSLTYILTNAFNNALSFQPEKGRIGLTLTHEFTKNVDVKQFGYRIELGDASPVTPARLFRQHLIKTGQFVSMADKIKKTPDAAKLLGAPHIYLWGDNLLARGDIGDYKTFAAKLVQQSTAPDASVGKRLWELMTPEARTLISGMTAAEFVDNFQKGQVADELTRILKLREFYQPAAWNGVEIPGVARKIIDAGIDKASPAEIGMLNRLLLHAAYPDVLTPPETWGDGFSTKLVQALADAGLDRLWLGSPGWDGLAYHPAMVKKAIELGYLIGPYDSFHSIHAPGDANTWETAQFNQHLYDTGGIVKADGSKRKGFKQKGYLLSPAAAKPYIEERVTKLANQFQCNSWFIDCDAFGEVFDDYSPEHPMTQASDAAERLRRMAWIGETFNTVIGSEGGSAYAAPVIHFAHGMMTPVIAWGDPDLMKNKSSKYYLGAYFPPDGPAIFFKQAPMKDEHRRVYADPRFRLPLYEIVFHDSVVATHQWGYTSFKFDDPQRTRELLEMLYNVPPMYHLNLAEWAKRKDAIQAHFAFFSPLHREAGLLSMTDFRWLTDDRMVQQTTFGDAIEITANFADKPFDQDGTVIPAQSVIAKHLTKGTTTTYPSQATAGK